MFEGVECVLALSFFFAKESDIAFGVWHGGDHGDQSECGVHATDVKPVPADDSRDEEVGPEGLDALSIQQQADGDGGHDASQEPHQVATGRVHRGEDNQPDGVIGDGDEQQEGNCRVSGPEDVPCNQEAEGDIGGAGHGPAVDQVGFIEYGATGDIKESRPEYSTGGGQQRHPGFSGAGEVSTG